MLALYRCLFELDFLTCVNSANNQTIFNCIILKALLLFVCLHKNLKGHQRVVITNISMGEMKRKRVNFNFVEQCPIYDTLLFSPFLLQQKKSIQHIDNLKDIWYISKYIGLYVTIYQMQYVINLFHISKVSYIGKS